MKKLVEAYAEWCGPCKVLERTLCKMALAHESINVDEDDDFVKKYGITDVPTMIVMDGSVELRRIIGAVDEAHVVEFLGEDIKDFQKDK